MHISTKLPTALVNYMWRGVYPARVTAAESPEDLLVYLGRARVMLRDVRRWLDELFPYGSMNIITSQLYLSSARRRRLKYSRSAPAAKYEDIVQFRGSACLCRVGVDAGRVSGQPRAPRPRRGRRRSRRPVGSTCRRPGVLISCKCMN
ncbi:hypothetical protein EVAR_79602_1 [Eumeta japonica]|uniref:Uncharacterized protein n=1 Tax=Eumeta variegata TaxID=151549 RepID=A0A4C1UE91_EUMVA|nr:hypothetical protein EVAR_79602_1 [Eumeta japonica]